MASLVRQFTALVFGTMMTASFAHAGDVSPTITVGTQEVGLTAGYMLSHRLTYLHKTQQHGPALMPSWMITLTVQWVTAGTVDKSRSAQRWSTWSSENRC
jgi:lipid A 3-O-deacylase